MSFCLSTDGHRWEFYTTTDGWRWRRVATNGNIVGASTEGYVNRADCVSNARIHGMNCNPF